MGNYLGSPSCSPGHAGVRGARNTHAHGYGAPTRGSQTPPARRTRGRKREGRIGPISRAHWLPPMSRPAPPLPCGLLVQSAPRDGTTRRGAFGPQRRELWEGKEARGGCPPPALPAGPTSPRTANYFDGRGGGVNNHTHTHCDHSAAFSPIVTQECGVEGRGAARQNVTAVNRRSPYP